MGQLLANNLDINFIETTISNVYGAGEVSERFISYSMRQLLSGKRPLFTAGEQLYDFIYIDDAVNMLDLIGKYGKANKNYYIGNKKP